MLSFLEGPKAALVASKDFDNGHYKTVPQHGIRAFGRAYSAWAYGQTVSFFSLSERNFSWNFNSRAVVQSSWLFTWRKVCKKSLLALIPIKLKNGLGDILILSHSSEKNGRLVFWMGGMQMTCLPCLTPGTRETCHLFEMVEIMPNAWAISKRKALSCRAKQIYIFP